MAVVTFGALIVVKFAKMQAFTSFQCLDFHQIIQSLLRWA